MKGVQNNNYLTKSFSWGFLSKLTTSIIKFFSVPILLTTFGEKEFALIALVLSLNGATSLLNMGMNNGAIHYYSKWINTKSYKKIDKVARTNVSFYLLIATINAIILVMASYFNDYLFEISEEDLSTFKNLIYFTAIFSYLIWGSNTFRQLLIANGEIYFSDRLIVLRNLFELLTVIIVLKCSISITEYYIILLIIKSSLIIPLYQRCKNQDLIKSFIPGFYLNDFRIVLYYSLSIFAMSIFQLLALKSRPIILSLYKDSGQKLLVEYNILEVFPLFLITVTGSIISILLPKASRLMNSNDKNDKEIFAYSGTKFTTFLTLMLAMPFILNAEEILTVYVGDKYKYLYPWLIVWVCTIIFSLHNSPVASLVLGSGKVKKLISSTALASFISILVNYASLKVFGVGSAILGYSCYILIQMSFYYIYFNNKVLNLDSKIIFKSFLLPTACAFISYGLIIFLNFKIENIFIFAFVKTFSWALIFTLLLVSFRIISIREYRLFKNLFNIQLQP